MPKLTRTFSARILAKGDDDGDHHDEHPDHWDHGRDHKHDNDVHPEIHNLKRGESALSAGATGHPEDHGIDLYKEHLEAEESFEKSRKNVRQLRADARERRATLRKERRAAKQAAEAEKHEEFEAVKRNERRQSAAAAAAEASEKSRRRYSHRVQRMNQRRAKVARMEVEPLVFNSERCGCGIPVGILGLSAVAATKLGLKEAHLRKMFQLCQAFDKDDSGCMSHGELIDLMDVPDTEFVRVMLDRVIFSAIEVRMEEDIDFDEFVLCSERTVEPKIKTFNDHDWFLGIESNSKIKSSSRKLSSTSISKSASAKYLPITPSASFSAALANTKQTSDILCPFMNTSF